MSKLQGDISFAAIGVAALTKDVARAVQQLFGGVVEGYRPTVAICVKSPSALTTMPFTLLEKSLRPAVVSNVLSLPLKRLGEA